MKGLRRFIAPFAPDQSGAAAVLCELGGMVIIMDAGGCAGNICGFDEPRWFDSRSAIFSAGLRDMDAILGRDELLVKKIAKASGRIQAKFIALIGTPVPAVIATDYQALRRMIEKKTGLKVLTIDTNGTETYEAGARKAWSELVKAFVRKPAEMRADQSFPSEPVDHSDTADRQDQADQANQADRKDRANQADQSEPVRIGVFGLTPLDLGEGNSLYRDNWGEYFREKALKCMKESGETIPDEDNIQISCYGMGASLEDLQDAGKNRLNIAASFSGLAAVRRLEKTLGIPYAAFCPPQLIPLRRIRETEGQSRPDSFYGGYRRILIVHQQIYANSLRELIEEESDAQVTVASWFGLDPELRREGDCILKEEDQWQELVREKNYNLIAADDLFAKAVPDYEGEWLSLPHFAVSGKRSKSNEGSKKSEGSKTFENSESSKGNKNSEGSKNSEIRPYAVESRVYGIVQGVGFRPTVSRHAAACGVSGSVSNMGPYVEIKAQGSKEAVEDFTDRVRHRPPERAVILRMDVRECEPSPEVKDFQIIESEKREGDIFVSPDIAICDRCKEEMYDPDNRRYLHPFINCTCCGPRLTILDSMPYDRIRTSMGGFPMCGECEYEYTHPETRRYDAQPVCCNDCGPEVYLLDRKERGADAIRFTRKVIRDGGIAAIKGIGGFHLCCDATSQEAVERLRKKKNRLMKPFAVMMKDMETVQRECEVFPEAEEILTGHQKPILLLRSRNTGHVCRAVAPDNPKLGVMLPYAPIQLLLFDYRDETELPDCLVMTSANVSGAPICRDDEDAREELGDICDVILSHNRMIRIRADDTVTDYDHEAGKPYMIRRSRGYAPLPVMMTAAGEKRILAAGGELKNTFCLTKGDLFYISPYIGDMTDVRTVRALSESSLRMEELLEMKPDAIACDLHPAYNTAAWAEDTAGRRGIPLIRIQHHYAHILSCMAEHDRKEPVIGAAFDGIGYGTDKTIWGGEILICDPLSFERYACIEPFCQTGGDLSSIEGWRIAVDLIYRFCAGEGKGNEEAERIIEDLKLCTVNEARTLHTMALRGINSVTSTGAGRLFDAVSAILGIRRKSTYEGEAATNLQFAAERSLERGGLKSLQDDTGHAAGKVGLLAGDSCRYLPTLSMVREITQSYLSGEDPEDLALLFHYRLAQMITKACVQAGREKGIDTAALSGGCYQNMLLLSLSRKMLEKEGFKVLTHSMVPPNDGGICLGQAYGAMARINHRERLEIKDCEEV